LLFLLFFLFLARVLPDEKGVDENPRYPDREGLGDSVLRSLVKLKNLEAGFMIRNMWPSYYRGVKYIKLMPSSNDLVVREKGNIGGKFKFYK
jgi:hypothetical protein